MNQEQEQTAVFVDFSDWRHLQATEGYVELGMFEEAEQELAALSLFCRTLAPTLALALRTYAGLDKWDLVESIARTMAEHEPDNAQLAICWASATRKAHSIEAAKEILLEALESHPNDPHIHYNLSCYESRLQHFKQARRHLARAIQLDPRYKRIALNDDDLLPLWERLSRWDE